MYFHFLAKKREIGLARTNIIIGNHNLHSAGDEVIV